MTGLTKKQKAIYDFIQQFITQNGYSPSYREILGHFELSSLGTVYKHLSALRRKGIVSSEAKCSRSIKPLLTPHNAATQASELTIPFIGQITETLEIEFFSEVHQLSLPSFIVANPSATYILRISGNAWMDEQISDGDLVVIDTQREVNPNETVVARINGQQIAIQRAYPEGQTIRLIGGKPGSVPLLYKADQVEIQGVVVAVIRLYN